MTSTTMSAVDRLVLIWVRVYSAGLSPETRERRLEQITSDLWEHEVDRIADGWSPARISIESFSRAARGAVTDVLWRWQLEEPQMQFNLPFERIGGGFLMLLVLAVMLSINVDGYDAGVEGFDGELRRLAAIADWQVRTYAALQVLAGLAMIAGACLMYLVLGKYAVAQALVAAGLLAAAGVLTIVTSAIYFATAQMADHYVASGGSEAVMMTARGLMLIVSGAVPATALAIALGVFGLALISGRHHLVPGWLTFIAAGSVVLLLACIPSQVVGFDAGSWLFLGFGFILMLIWLLVAGLWFLLNKAARKEMNLVAVTAPQQP